MVDFDTIVDDFSFLDDWEERYKYIIDLGRHLPAYPENDRDEAHKVTGCASQVWLTHELETIDGETCLTLSADSDAHIVRGLIAILLALYSRKPVREIATMDTQKALTPLDLKDHLTPQRSNGFAAMIAKIKTLAEQNHS